MNRIFQIKGKVSTNLIYKCLLVDLCHHHPKASVYRKVSLKNNQNQPRRYRFFRLKAFKLESNLLYDASTSQWEMITQGLITQTVRANLKLIFSRWNRSEIHLHRKEIDVKCYMSKVRSGHSKLGRGHLNSDKRKWSDAHLNQ